MADIFDQPAFMQRLNAANSSLAPRPIVDGRSAAIAPLLSRQAMIVGQIGAVSSFDDRWCHYTDEPALAAREA